MACEITTDNIPTSAESGDTGKTDRTWVAIGAGVLGAIAAATCCVVPLALFTLGISGAWIGNLTALAPYQPIFVAFAAGALLYGFFRVYRRPVEQCGEGYCASPSSTRVLKIALWIATFLVVAAVAFPYVAVQFLQA